MMALNSWRHPQSRVLLYIVGPRPVPSSCSMGLGQVAGAALVQQAAGIMHDITHASRAQGGEIGEVNTAMAELGAITRQNAALVEQSAAASNNVAEEAGRPVQALSVFKFGAEKG